MADDVSFADLLNENESHMVRQSIRVGGKVEGMIASINPDSDNVLVEVDSLHTGVIDKNQLYDESGSLKFHVGDRISAFVISRRDEEVILSLTMSKSHQTIDDLHMAKANQLPVKGKVTGENKGGFEVTVMGKTCFCPVSQMDIRFVQNKAEYMGRELDFVIEKIEEGGKNIVVSRAKLLKIEAEEKIAELEGKLDQDIILDGVVSELRDYGAFIDLGGIDGFLHVSEMSYSRINRAGDFLDKGDKVRVKVLNIETVKGKRRISLSMKAVGDDPWTTITEDYKEGNSYQGKVVKLESFGAFIEIASGIEGLIHISEMSWEKRIMHPSEVLKVGDAVNVRILKIDLDAKRISLSLKNIDEDPWVKAMETLVPGSQHRGQIISLKGFGAIVELIPGVTGLLPIGVLKQAYGESFRKEASPPKEIDIIVREINEDEKKVLLSLPNLSEDSNMDDAFKDYLNRRQETKEKEPAPSHGSFGAILAAKLNEKK